MESDFYEKLEKLDVQAGKKDKIFSDHITQVCEAHGQVISSYLQQIHRSPGADAKGSTTLGKMCIRKRQKMHAWSKAEGTSNESGISMVKLRAAILTPSRVQKMDTEDTVETEGAETQMHEQGPSGCVASAGVGGGMERQG